jgi:hypothetical protein
MDRDKELRELLKNCKEIGKEIQELKKRFSRYN